MTGLIKRCVNSLDYNETAQSHTTLHHWAEDSTAEASKALITATASLLVSVLVCPAELITASTMLITIIDHHYISVRYAIHGATNHYSCSGH